MGRRRNPVPADLRDGQCSSERVWAGNMHASHMYGYGSGKGRRCIKRGLQSRLHKYTGSTRRPSTRQGEIGVAGYPEGCDDNLDPELLMQHLKEKVDAGGTFIVTQMFYDVDIFLDWVSKVRAAGITVPIIPGIMPISTHAAFLRRANWSNSHIPPKWREVLEPVKNDDAAVREIGTGLVADMCRKIIDAGIKHLHLYV